MTTRFSYRFSPLQMLCIAGFAYLSQALPCAAQTTSPVAASAPASVSQTTLQPARPLADPWVPPEQRVAASQPPASGAALQAQALHKLQQQFHAAAAPHQESLTKEQAKAAGLAYVANHFEQIDHHKTGKVSFDDVTQYMKRNGANLP